MLRSLTAACLATLLAACGPAMDENASAEPQAEPSRVETTDEFRAQSVDLGPRDQMPGAALYAQNCNSCHNGTVPKAPHITFLEMLSPAAILKTMNEGIMMAQAEGLSGEQRRQVAEYITQSPADEEMAPAYAMACPDDTQLDLGKGIRKVGWGHDTRRFSDAETAGMTAQDAASLELKWAYAFPDALRARSQPSVGYGAVYVGSHDGSVYSFDLETGCAHWRFQADAEVRTGIILIDGTDESPPLAVFGDLLARLQAVNALTGELVWSFKVDDHPSATLTATPTLHDGVLYVNVSSLEVTAAADPTYPCCSFRGKTMAVDAATGNVAWTHYSIPTPPVEVKKTRVGTPVLSPSGAPIWASPTIDADRRRVYVGTGENYSSPADENSDAVIAIDMDSGERVWQRQTFSGDAWNVACMMADNPNCPEENGPDLDHGSSILLVETDDGGDILIAGLKTGGVIALDPDENGKLVWSAKVGRGSIQGGVHFGLAAEGSTVYVPINDMNDTRSGHVLSAEDARPGVHALDAATGKLLWSHVQDNVCPDELQFCDPGVSAPVTAFPGAVVAGHLDGFIRIYAKEDGEVLWEYDTKQPVTAINGLKAIGGGMSGAGPMVADGYLISNSGYGLYFHEPGNMLAVFAPTDR
ncbi:MAG: PQQ-binding-like beta-propeller repeat protein [Woeseiaceae bacterium]|nr:PQQ-binding-like beta-propeller repeat protein [Woeseiaceae bacterium]